MQEYITELSKYAIAVLMALYTFECFLALVHKIKHKQGIYIRQRLYIFMLQIIFFANLFLVSEEAEYIFYYAFVQVLLFMIIVMVSMIYENCNRLLLNNMCMLLGIGLCMIARLSFQKALKQYVIVMLSFLICLLIPFLIHKLTVWKKFTWFYASVGIFMLGAVLILGEVTHGSKISYTIQGVTFQPSEFVKILFIFFLAGALWEKTDLLRVSITAVMAGVHVILLVASRDLGSALIFFVAFVMVVFFATRNYFYLITGFVAGVSACLAAYHLFDHVRIRVLAWRDPWSYIDNQGYQITQSLFAIGSGSWFGMGLMQGTPKDIPYVDADFIFSSICEELGVIFGICLILVCMSCFIMMMNIAVKQKDSFFKLIICGLGIMYIFQIFLTIGGGIKFIPLTGVTLPFVSYGGSSVLTTMILFFIVQAIATNMNGEGGKRHVHKTKES